eukprot:15257741-Alexandrium_andersonii.AAC.1
MQDAGLEELPSQAAAGDELQRLGIDRGEVILAGERLKACKWLGKYRQHKHCSGVGGWGGHPDEEEFAALHVYCGRSAYLRYPLAEVGPRIGLCPVGAGPHLREHI